MKTRKLLLFLIFIFTALIVNTQALTHTTKVHFVGYNNKQIGMLGYELGIRRMSVNLSAGIGQGTDNQFLSSDKINDDLAKQKLNLSQTIFPKISPPFTYLEACNSTYKIEQLRLGFTIFVRRNDTLGRQASTGPHIGVEGMLTNIIESQSVTYKSNLDETRYIYSGINKFYTAGAATHFGWQFSFLKEHLYVDLLAAIVFYYPFITDINYNSPFAGNRIELQTSVGWRFNSTKQKQIKNSEKKQIRSKI